MIILSTINLTCCAVQTVILQFNMTIACSLQLRLFCVSYAKSYVFFIMTKCLAEYVFNPLYRIMFS